MKLWAGRNRSSVGKSHFRCIWLLPEFAVIMKTVCVCERERTSVYVSLAKGGHLVLTTSDGCDGPITGLGEGCGEG